jgi:hypothetical protein
MWFQAPQRQKFLDQNVLLLRLRRGSGGACLETIKSLGPPDAQGIEHQI